MGGNNKRKVNIPMCAALVLLLFTMISIHLTSGLYARYTTTATGGDSARVAKFDVGAEMSRVADKENEYTLTVTNNSEVAVTYKVVVTMDDHLDVKLDSVQEGISSISDGKKIVTFTNPQWAIGPNVGSRAHKLNFSVMNWFGLTDKDHDNGPTEPVSLGFSVEVIAEQID